MSSVLFPFAPDHLPFFLDSYPSFVVVFFFADYSFMEFMDPIHRDLLNYFPPCRDFLPFHISVLNPAGRSENSYFQILAFSVGLIIFVL